MADLTTLDEKLAEVLGLAMAAQDATKKVEGLFDEENGGAQVTSDLQRMREQAEETEQRCEGIADRLDGKKTAVLEKARETKQEAKDMMSTYLGSDAEGLDGLEFLVMAEAGEVGHWEVLGALSKKAADEQLRDLVEWALPIQEQHLSTVRSHAVAVAEGEDPHETS